MRHFPDDDNGDVLRRLEEHGANFERPHRIEFFFVFGSREAAAACADAIRLRGEFEVEVLHDAAEERSELMAARRMMLDHAAITAAEELLSATARQHGGEPDGWGTMQEEC